MIVTAALGLEIAAIGVAVGIANSTLESFWHLARGNYGPGGIWSWSVLREAHGPGLAKALSPLLTGGAMPVLLSLRLLGAAALPVLYLRGLNPAPALAVLIVLQFLLQIRSRWGGEGADQMTVVVLVASFIAATTPHAVVPAALFIGGQISLSYLASGTAKLFGPMWRRGEALGRIMNHHQYGHRGLAGLLARYPILNKLAGSVVIGFQVSFFVFYLLPLPYALVYPLAGMAFHLGIAYFMRLNLFFVTFVGTYGCLIFTHEWVRALVAG
jgi:hypothetical protein